jgi:two-component system, chemotaxis family, chemotaxis protein CheY
MRILVVEDEKISRAYLFTIVKSYGECDVAENGVTAVEKIEKAFEEQDRYDIIFLDIMLPKMTGHQVLQIIRAYEKDHVIEERTRVIMTSALKDNENVKKAYENLADGYIVKPIFKDKIEEIIKKYKEEIKE